MSDDLRLAESSPLRLARAAAVLRDVATDSRLDAVTCDAIAFVVRKLEEVDADTARRIAAIPTNVPRRGADEDTLRRVGECYDLARTLSTRPTMVVAEHFGVSRSTAGRWLAEANARAAPAPLP